MGPAQIKVHVKALFPLGSLTCFPTVSDTDMPTSLWLQASQMAKGMEWIKFPFWSLNRRSTGTRTHSINYLCFSNCSQWYTGPAWCLQASLTKHRHFNGWLPWDTPGLGKKHSETVFLLPWLYAWSECMPLPQLGQEATALHWLNPVSGPNSHQSFSINFSTACFQSQVILDQPKRHFREWHSNLAI